jgi:hypothetical protein
MAFGLQILTTDGLVNVVDLRAARLFFSQDLTSQSGTIVVNGFNEANGFIFLRPNDSNLVASWTWNNSSKVFSWSPYSGVSNSSSNMTAFFMVTT